MRTEAGMINVVIAVTVWMKNEKTNGITVAGVVTIRKPHEIGVAMLPMMFRPMQVIVTIIVKPGNGNINTATITIKETEVMIAITIVRAVIASNAIATTNGGRGTTITTRKGIVTVAVPHKFAI